MDYITYFFGGARTPAMLPSLVAAIGAIRYALLFLAGALAQGLANQFASGNYTLDFRTLLGYVMPAVIILLGFFWKYIREAQNPFVTGVPPVPPPAGVPPVPPPPVPPVL